MRVDRITATAFGPLRNAQLDLVPGLNVIEGPNEAGKSTWQAAIRAALTGVRRGRGRRPADQLAFEELHRPWDRPDDWQVGARLALDDGRQIDIVQDLADRVASRAMDIGLGRDVSDEIMHDGSPDASRWLGLDREAFARTAWVGQGEILAVSGRETADLLQDYLQRAAASQGADATAAEALGRVEEFRKHAIGTDFATTRPLRAAKDGLARATEILETAREQHALYMTLLARAEDARIAYESAAIDCRAMRAAISMREAAEERTRAERAAELAARYATKPAGAPERDQLSDRVAAALHGWRSHPTLMPARESNAEQLADEIAALPPPPVGELEPATDVEERHETVTTARGVLESLGAAPVVSSASPTGGLSEAELRQLAADLAIAVPEVPEPLQRRLGDFEQRVLRLQRARGPAFVGLLGAVVVGTAAVVLGSLPIGGVMLLVAIALIVWSIRRSRQLGEARHGMASVRSEIAPIGEARAIAMARRGEAIERARATGLAPDATDFVGLADEARGQVFAVRDADGWRVRHEAADRAVVSAEDALRNALVVHGCDALGVAIDDAYAAYVAACRARRDQADLAARRDSLEKVLRARQDANAGYVAAATQIEAATRVLREVTAEACGVTFENPDEMVTVLERWQTDRADRVAADDRARAEWEELQALLMGRTLSDLIARADDVERRAAALIVGLPRERIPDAEAASAHGLTTLESTEHQCLADKETAEAQRSALANSMLDVTEAEEEVIHFAEELQRLDALATVVDMALELLRTAEQRVHRDIAPVLAAAVQRHLPRITEGRYTEVAVDPADLRVMVKEARSGQWRAALALSGGTREQIYLLLRVAMGEHLAVQTETAPLFLDEVTAQSDPGRAREIMSTLQTLSQDRQVVVFTHDPAIAEWAERHLTAPRDQLIRVEQLPLGAASAGDPAQIAGQADGPAESW